MTKNAKARNGATGVKAPEVKENNVDPALVKEIDKELGVLADAGLIAGTGEQPRVEFNVMGSLKEGEQPHVGLIVEPGKPVEETDHRVGGVPLGELLYAEESGARLGSKENPLPDLTEGAKKEETEVASVYLDIPPPVGRRRYSKRREEYKDWPVGKARIFKNFKTNPVNAVLYPLVDDGYKFQSQKQEKGTEPGTANYIVWRVA